MGFLFLSDYFFKQTTATNKQTSKPRIIFISFSLLDRSIWNRLFERIGKPYKRQPVRGLRFAEYLPQSRRFFCSLFGRCRLFLCYPFFILIIDFWFSFILWAITIAELIVLALSTSLPDTRILNHSRKFGFLHIVIMLLFPFVKDWVVKELVHIGKLFFCLGKFSLDFGKLGQSEHFDCHIDSRLSRGRSVATSNRDGVLHWVDPRLQAKYKRFIHIYKIS